MLNVLLESRAPAARRMGSTVASAFLHTALIAGAVSLTQARQADATVAAAPDAPAVHYVPVPDERRMPYRHRPRTDDRPPLAPYSPGLPSVDISEVDVPVPPIDPVFPGPDEILTANPIGRTVSPYDPTQLRGVAGAPIEERLVDRTPRLLGRPVEPCYPSVLLHSGVEGRVVVQFVVDTLGGAELQALQVVESADPQFVEAVRAALARYRFSAGEVAGRKVRTRVQMPFQFTLRE